MPVSTMDQGRLWGSGVGLDYLAKAVVRGYKQLGVWTLGHFNGDMLVSDNYTRTKREPVECHRCHVKAIATLNINNNMLNSWYCPTCWPIVDRTNRDKNNKQARKRYRRMQDAKRVAAGLPPKWEEE